ncbi:hypothetical protein HZ326_24851 [Fusarium oxysporum f. sp. albedinis]|nr:hypothetical protein HZ326_24851 [Fusarium oxysporum f. sp. albedinis]
MPCDPSTSSGFHNDSNPVDCVAHAKRPADRMIIAKIKLSLVALVNIVSFIAIRSSNFVSSLANMIERDKTRALSFHAMWLT